MISSPRFTLGGHTLKFPHSKTLTIMDYSEEVEKLLIRFALLDCKRKKDEVNYVKYIDIQGINAVT